jgi:hypothetical protein
VEWNSRSILTCNSIDALAHKTALLTAGNPLAKGRFKPISLSGDEFTRIVTSSMPSFPIIDHPSSVNPLSASLKPLPENTYQILNSRGTLTEWRDHIKWWEYVNLLSLWLRALRAAGRLPQPVTLDWETSWAICLSWRKAWMKMRENFGTIKTSLLIFTIVSW